jgi:hypothetical protein
LPSGTTNINGSPGTPRLTLEVLVVCGKRGRKRAGRNEKMLSQAIVGK